jgi:hypothetical membrane protein
LVTMIFRQTSYVPDFSSIEIFIDLFISMNQLVISIFNKIGKKIEWRLNVCVCVCVCVCVFLDVYVQEKKRGVT